MKINEYTVQKERGYMHYIVPEPDLAARFLQKGQKRLICTINNNISFHCGLLSRKGIGHYINIASAVAKQLQLKPGTKVRASFKADTSTYGFDMPEEFKEVLATDPVANQIFHALTEGGRRSIMYLVSTLKSSDKRIERSLMIAEKLKSGVTSARTILNQKP